MKRALIYLLAGLALPAWADRLPLPGDTPASYRNECGSCHLAYPPALLGAADWRKLQEKLDTHFGSDARLDEPARREIAAFLERHAAPAGRLGQSAQSADKAPRITRTPWFERKHRELASSVWHNPQVKSPANCEACHRQAASGRFSEHDVVLPGRRGS